MLKLRDHVAYYHNGIESKNPYRFFKLKPFDKDKKLYTSCPIGCGFNSESPEM